MKAKLRYQPGRVIGCYHVLELLEDAPSREHRRYAVRASCCGRDMVRLEQSLDDYVRHPREHCHKCAQALANERMRGSCGFHERFGPVVVLGRGTEPKHWRVQWDCCGAELELERKYLVTLRRKHRAGNGAPSVCLACAIKATREVVAERAVPPAGVLLERRVVRPVEEPPVKVRATAEFSPGVVSAAVAWPRPGARA